MAERNTHDYGDELHLDLETDGLIVLSAGIGAVAAGSPVQDVLIAIDAAITALERRFTASAVIV